MDKKALVIVLVISVIINLATVFTFGYFWMTRNRLGEGPVREPHMARDWRDARIVRELCLSRDQMVALRKANEDLRTAMQPLREELFEKRRELMSLLRTAEPDRDRAKALIKEIGELQVNHDMQIFERLLAMRDVLDPDQCQKLGALLHTFLEQERPQMPRFRPQDHRHFQEVPPPEGGE